MSGIRLPISLVALLSVIAPGCHRSAPNHASFPARPIKVIVPFAAGGGSDQFARIIQSAVEQQQLLPEKLVIINVPGAGGTIGSRRVKNARPDGYTILLLHEGMMTAKYSGRASYGHESFAAIAGSGDATQVIAVAGDCPYQNLDDLMADATTRPDEIIFAANLGAPSHFAGLMLEQRQVGAAFRYTQTGGGAKRFAALQGGHATVTAFSIAEYLQFRPAGIRALALLGKQRNEQVPELATAIEQGYDVVSQNMQFWWAPEGTGSEPIEIIANAIEQAMRDASVREQLAQLRIDPVFVRGVALEREVESRAGPMAAVSTGTPDILPNFPRITLIVVSVLAILAVYQRRNHPREKGPQVIVPKRLVIAAAGVIGWTVGYVILLQSTAIGFRAGTALFIFCTGLTLFQLGDPRGRSKWSTSRVATSLGVLAIGLSLGVHYLFTAVLVVDLP